MRIICKCAALNEKLSYEINFVPAVLLPLPESFLSLTELRAAIVLLLDDVSFGSAHV